ncbi:GNAT family N-acetyltransferase [Saccharibacillus sp. O16]|nr:GNAT family N-acetyltransferase [Saccharibacillus sp. O16]
MRPVREECSLASIRERGKSADSTLTVRSISYGSEAYAKSLQLRNKVLRRPLGRDIAHDDLSGDVQSRHIGAFLDTRLVGILLLRPIHRQVLQMKQVAVEESLRGLQIGRQMVEYAEKFAAGEGCQEIRLHAREVAIPFYEKLGYVREGEPFEEVGIPHSLMKKRLM